MALKKKASTSKEEQLFMLEVFIDRVNLQPEGTSSINTDDMIVCVKFTDLPEYELHVPKCNQNDHTNHPDEIENDQKFGKSCIFAKTPSNLIKALRYAPLRLEVYQTESSTMKNGAVLGTATISLPACMCNQVSSARNRINGLASPCIVRDTFDLTDSTGKTSGNVSVALRLSCFGSSIVKRFCLSGKSFVLEDSPLQKFLCPYLNPSRTDSRDENIPVEPSLRRPVSPPRISINDPGFKQLTTAEKLNDPKFRELVYRAYPDEPTCCCLPTDRSTHPMECRSGCNRPCCMKLRNPEALTTHKGKPTEDTSVGTYCVNDSNGEPPCASPTRLRGGGDIEQIYVDPSGYHWTDYDTDCTWYNERNHGEVRLEGGGENNMSSCSCSGGTVPVKKSQSKEKNLIDIFNACKPRVTSTGPKPSCACAGKDTEMWHTGAAKCSREPCVGVDCLIRAFQEAQEFVDSIGKVPGLPGLGLMDPSESPFFGRDLDKDYVPQEPPKPERKRLQSIIPQAPPPPPCSAPCNTQRGKSCDDVRAQLPYVPPAPLGALMLPPRLGIVREAIPVLPEVGPMTSTKQRKRDEKKEDRIEKHKDHDIVAALMDTEMGPCGEPRCKSRRKRPAEVTDGTQSATQVASKTATGQKSTRGSKKRRGGTTKHRSPVHVRGRGGGGREKVERGGVKTTAAVGHRRGKDSGHSPGPGGDRDQDFRPPISVNRRVMRFVYFVGDHYPGIYYGHRDCIDVPMRVPANMGWLWNTLAIAGNLKPRIGWKPGAISRYVYELMQEAKENSLLEETASATTTKSAGKTGTSRGKTTEHGRPGTGRGKTVIERDRTGKMTAGRGKTTIDRSRGGAGERGRSATTAQRSMSRRRNRRTSESLQRVKATMNDEEEGSENPPTLHIHRKDGTYYVTMYPIKQKGEDEPRLSEPMKPLQFKIMKNKDDGSVASSSTASDMEIEFSPPAAVTRQRKKPDVVHVDTQVRQQEILDAIKTESAKKKDRRSRRERKSKPETTREKTREKEGGGSRTATRKEN
ncbi:uncharacterized protein LOC128893959 [Hylaeus anthracinus]|uniref:uncharacterized protein LOC128893959 n=1 Tax=Hylaeus anthracinus TaxID=313031 RepID=UPI0023B8D1AC|nr:uncharacterized protein LOC128893959 [Hylaeus anthracinus]